MLSTYAPDDEIFKVNYRPPSKVKRIVEQQAISNFDGLYTVLDTLNAKQLKKKGRNLFFDAVHEGDRIMEEVSFRQPQDKSDKRAYR